MRSCSGFILIMTLIFITVISLLVLTCMQHVFLYHKAINSLKMQHTNFYQLEAITLKLLEINSIGKAILCTEKGDDPNLTMTRLTKHEGCTFIDAAHKFQYLIEDLGDYPCLQVRLSEKMWSTHHRRISVLLLSKDDTPDSFMQIRQISAIEQLQCIGEVYKITLGLSSWRYLSRFK